MNLVKFSKYEQFNKKMTYHLSGLGEKISCDLLYNGELYKLKTGKNYRYESLSEYIGSHIFEFLGVPAQQTILGTYVYQGTEMLAVIYKNFAVENYFMSFDDVVGEIVKTFVNGEKLREGNIDEMDHWLAQQPFVDKQALINFFWKMCIIDIYIGNVDRSWENWGILLNENKNNSIAPVFDCGACLYYHELSHDNNFGINFLDTLRKGNLVVFPKSPIFKLGKNNSRDFCEYLSTTDNENCLKALKDILNVIEQKESCIMDWIEKISVLSYWEKMFYIEVLRINKEQVLKQALAFNRNSRLL